MEGGRIYKEIYWREEKIGERRGGKPYILHLMEIMQCLREIFSPGGAAVPVDGYQQL